MKKKYHLLLLVSSTIFIVFILFSGIEVECLFHKYLHFECGTCGLTRGFKSLLSLNLVEATKFNLFTIPVFISVLTYYFISISDLILKNNNINKFYNLVYKNIKIILILYIFSLIINNI